MKHHILSLRTLLLSTAFWLPLLLLLAVTSCERRPLEVLIKEKVQIRVVMEWQVNYVQLYNEKPNGMTLRIWGSDNVPVLNQITNSDTVMVQLPPGTYYVMAYNELASEYAEYGMHFYDYNDYAAMTFRSSHYTRATNALGEGLPHLVPPEYPRIAVALDTVVITQDMVVEQDSVLIPYEEFEEKGYKRDYVYTRVLEFDEVPWPMTVDLKVALLVKHRDRLARVEGTISGMADGFYVTQVRRTSETASLWLDPSSERWRRAKYSDDADQLGLLQTSVACYGLPYGKELIDERQETDNVLQLRLTLTDGKSYDFSYNVGKLIRYIDPDTELEKRIRYRQDLRHLRLEVNLPDPIDLPEVDPSAQTGAGFDAKVDEWEDGGTIDMGGF